MKPTEKLLNAPVDKLIEGMGMAVAKANKALAEIPGNDIVYAINGAEIELKVAITVDRDQEVGVDAGVAVGAFSMNASYKGTFGYKEEASSTIKLNISAKPRETAAPDDTAATTV